MCGHQFRRRANNHVVVLAVVTCAASFAFLTPSPAQTLVPRGSEQPSFDCSKARTAAARLICADGELARLDGELGAAFQNRKAQLSPTVASAFVSDVLAWIRDRNTRCDLVGKNDAAIDVLATSKPCIASAIQQRIASLLQSASASAPMPPSQQEPMPLIPPSSSHSTSTAQAPIAQRPTHDPDEVNDDNDAWVVAEIEGKGIEEVQEAIEKAQSAEEKGDYRTAFWHLRRAAKESDDILANLTARVPSYLDERDLKMSPTQFAARVQSYLDKRKLKMSPTQIAARVQGRLAELKSKMNPDQIADAEKAADFKDARAAIFNGPEEDRVRALKFLRLLAEQGDAPAEQLLGTAYHYGNGVPESKVEAAKWYRKAAEQGYAQAQRDLGYLYQKGIGVLRDVVTADMWLDLAAAAGESDAADERDELEKRMSPAQIAEAEKLAREWKPITQPAGR
jgi:TPR repeat protein